MKTTDLIGLIDRFPLLADLIALKEITGLIRTPRRWRKGCHMSG